MSIKVIVPEEAIDLTNNSVRFDLLNLRYTQIDEIYVNGQDVKERSFSRDGSVIKFAKPVLKGNDEVVIYSTVAARRLNIEAYVAIIVALIGLVGNIAQALISKEPTHNSAPKKRIVMFEPDMYGVNKLQKQFMTSMRWEEPNEQNCAFSESIVTSHKSWAFVRIKGDLKDIRETVVGELTGPMPMRNGMRFGVNIPPSIYAEYEKNKKWIQLIVIAAPKDRTVVPGRKISELGSDVKVILSPSVGPSL